MAENDGTFLCGNLIPADGGYYILSFDALTDEWGAAVEADRINPESFLPIWADGFAGITAWCQSADDPRGTTLTQAFYIPGDQEVVLDYKDGLYTPQNPATAFRSCTAACAWRLPTPLPDSIIPMCSMTGTPHTPFRRAWSIRCSIRRPAITAIF